MSFFIGASPEELAAEQRRKREEQRRFLEEQIKEKQRRNSSPPRAASRATSRASTPTEGHGSGSPEPNGQPLKPIIPSASSPAQAAGSPAPRGLRMRALAALHGEDVKEKERREAARRKLQEDLDQQVRERAERRKQEEAARKKEQEEELKLVLASLNPESASQTPSPAASPPPMSSRSSRQEQQPSPKTVASPPIVVSRRALQSLLMPTPSLDDISDSEDPPATRASLKEHDHSNIPGLGDNNNERGTPSPDVTAAKTPHQPVVARHDDDAAAAKPRAKEKPKASNKNDRRKPAGQRKPRASVRKLRAGSEARPPSPLRSPTKPAWSTRIPRSGSEADGSSRIGDQDSSPHEDLAMLTRLCENIAAEQRFLKDVVLSQQQERARSGSGTPDRDVLSPSSGDLLPGSHTPPVVSSRRRKSDAKLPELRPPSLARASSESEAQPQPSAIARRLKPNPRAQALARLSAGKSAVPTKYELEGKNPQSRRNMSPVRKVVRLRDAIAMKNRKKKEAPAQARSKAPAGRGSAEPSDPPSRIPKLKRAKSARSIKTSLQAILPGNSESARSPGMHLNGSAHYEGEEEVWLGAFTHARPSALRRTHLPQKEIELECSSELITSMAQISVIFGHGHPSGQSPTPDDQVEYFAF